MDSSREPSSSLVTQSHSAGPKATSPLEGTASSPPQRSVPPSWNELADGFETMGKVGIALAVGFSAAGFFCRMAEQGKVKMPSLPSLLLGGQLAARSASNPASPDAKR